MSSPDSPLVANKLAEPTNTDTTIPASNSTLHACVVALDPITQSRLAFDCARASNAPTAPVVPIPNLYVSTPSGLQAPPTHSPVVDYHGGIHGLPLLTNKDIIKHGFTATTSHNILDYDTHLQDIRSTHSVMIKTWTNLKYNTNGPQVHCIIEKGLQVFLRLPSTDARDVVDFYNQLHKVGLAHLLPTTNFDSIVLCLNHIGLYPPGLGIHKFRESSKGMLELIPFLVLPNLSNNVNAAIAAVKSTTKNNYELLWHILRLFCLDSTGQ